MPSTPSKPKPDMLIELLHDVQEAVGYVPETVQAEIAQLLNISTAEVHGVVSFYDDFYEVPAAKHVVRLCRGEACQAQGGEALAQHLKYAHGLENHQKNTEGLQYEPVYCLGNCAAGPAAMIDGKLYGRLDVDRLAQILSGVKA